MKSSIAYKQVGKIEERYLVLCATGHLVNVSSEKTGVTPVLVYVTETYQLQQFPTRARVF